MMPQNATRVLDAHPHSRHPRIAIRVPEVNLAADKDVSVIRAPRRQDQRGQENDLNSRDNGTSHRTVLIENSKREYRNSKQIRMSKIQSSKTWDISEFRNCLGFRASHFEFERD
jgi:hypothetical protein